MINSFNRLYSWAFNRFALLERCKVNSLARFLVRKIANRVLPLWLNRPVSPGNLPASKIYGKCVIVSLTSCPKRIPKLWMVIECLRRQTVRPDKILLYLSKAQFPGGKNELPESLLRYESDGYLDIVWVDNDFRSHKKYYYTMCDFPDDLIITVDDDIFYPTTMIQTLMDYHTRYPGAVIARYARKLAWTESDTLKSSTEWKHLRDTVVNNPACFFGTGGGTLFPSPSACLYKDTLNIELARRLCPLEDDLWLNTMVRLQGTPIVVVKDYKDILPVQSRGDVKLYSQNGGEENMTDRQMKQVVSYYKAKGLFPYSKP